MRTLVLTAIIGIVAGFIDILPMIKMKLDKYATYSAFIFYLIMPFIIFNIDLLGNIWWIKGGAITLILALPIMIIVAKEEKKSIPPMIIMSVVLGTLIGIAGHLFNFI